MSTATNRLLGLAWRPKPLRVVSAALPLLVLIVFPAFTSHYFQNIVMEMLIFGLFAMSLNLLWGYTGLPSLGHAAYFGAAGYTVGLLLVNCGIDNFWLLAPAGILVSGLLAAMFGVLALRMTGGYFLLVTLAMGELLYSVVQKWRSVTGGDNGLAGITLPNLHIPGLVMTVGSFYYLVLIIFCLGTLLIYRIANSPFGEALQGIRENEPRMRALGYNTWLYKYIAFIVAGLFAGVAGVLFAPFNGLMSPVHVSVSTSVIAMLMVVIGSTRTIVGPLVGAVVVVIIQYVAIIYVPERWPLILGLVFIFSVMFLRGGITVYLIALGEKVFRARTSV